MDKELASVIKYFAFFDYFPEFVDVYTFFPRKISKKQLKNLIEANKYTVGEYSKNKVKSQKSKVKISRKKLDNWRFRTYIWLISLFPQIKLVGLSGSISMMNADLDDDIDLFIITKKQRLFTGRFLATIIAFIIGLKRPLGLKKASNKVCLNLFFDEGNLKIPKFKQSKFVGHEVLQMKPIINKDYTYERFLYENRWVVRFFPNTSWIMLKVKIQKSRVQVKSQNFSLLSFNFIELIFKKAQLFMINRHRTTELISNTQLWFHPDDFEKKIKF
ncbi:hypothetical protein HZA76_00425 [Candidatus Roizmanbacteria bacterium]|nr:hypothetical protein [Candidatus Roizmanbacteria bacterium]